MTQTIFTPTTKMAEMMLCNFQLLSIIPRFDIKLGFGEKSVQKVCEQHAADTHFLLMVCNLHTFRDYRPGPQELMQTNIQSVVEYLRKSHQYYINTGLQKISAKVQKLAQNCAETHGKTLQNFFDQYQNQILKHFGDEEEKLFPYIQKLLQNPATAYATAEDFDPHHYEENHEEIDAKLSDLKNIILKYLPVCENIGENGGENLREQLLMDLFAIEDDMHKHTRIEEKVLGPLIKKIEDERK